MVLVFASNNAHKLDEVRAIMPDGIEVLSLKDIGFEQEIEETGSTLEANSQIKAEAVWSYVWGQPIGISRSIDGIFADDTGMEIDALAGRPGVYTARWSGCAGDEQAVFAANRAKALQELAGQTNRKAQFRTVITLLTPNSALPEGKEKIQVEGVVRGLITTEEYGKGGFGYDPIFMPEGYEKTFGELSPEIKNEISHRARAMQELCKVLRTLQ